ncbi:MAG: RHS repeat-associated core domain-containing protein, partial [Bacteroides sp.]
SLKRILVDGGYIENDKYYYYIQDHLGNNRVVAQADGSVLQASHYYPFGMTFTENNTGDSKAQPYKYNGKEFDGERGLNVYDYSARYMDPALGRFMTVDPMAEKYPSLTPYHYCANNPLIFIDPDGRKIVLAGTQAQMQQTLATLQKLTSDQLTVNYSTGVVKIPTLSTSGNLPSGTALIRELNSKLPGAKTVTIDNQNSTGVFPAGITGNVAGHMPNLDATNGVGVDAYVSFDPTSNPTITTEDPATGNAQGTNRPNEIGLGHELVHAQHYMTGTKGTGTTSYTYKDAAGNTQTTSDKTEEVNTVGLGGNSKYTENKLRQEQRAAATTPAQQNQLNPRVKY